MLISSLPGANPHLPEHKIGVFVRFWLPEPPFSGFSSTKSRFLCAFGLRNPHFRAFRAQNRGFCAFLGFETPVFRRFEHKIEVFVRFCPSRPPFSGVSSTKSGFLCAFFRDGGFCWAWQSCWCFCRAWQSGCCFCQAWQSVFSTCLELQSDCRSDSQQVCCAKLSPLLTSG